MAIRPFTTIYCRGVWKYARSHARSQLRLRQGFELFLMARGLRPAIGFRAGTTVIETMRGSDSFLFVFFGLVCLSWLALAGDECVPCQSLRPSRFTKPQGVLLRILAIIALDSYPPLYDWSSHERNGYL